MYQPVTSIPLRHPWRRAMCGRFFSPADWRILYLATNVDASKNACYAQELGEGRPRTPVMKDSRRARRSLSQLPSPY